MRLIDDQSPLTNCDLWYQPKGDTISISHRFPTSPWVFYRPSILAKSITIPSRYGPSPLRRVRRRKVPPGWRPRPSRHGIGSGLQKLCIVETASLPRGGVLGFDFNAADRLLGAPIGTRPLHQEPFCRRRMAGIRIPLVGTCSRLITSFPRKRHLLTHSNHLAHTKAPVKEQLSAANHPVLFDALLEFDENRTLHRPVTDPPYVGPPSPEIDAAWKELMGRSSSTP